MAEQILTIADFIKQTIIQVTNGLHDAQKEVRSKGTQIFPDSYGDSAETTNIDFDLAVTQTSNDSNAKLGVALGWLKAGMSSGEAASEFANHVKFSVKVGFVVLNPADSKKPRHIPMRDTGHNLEDY